MTKKRKLKSLKDDFTNANEPSLEYSVKIFSSFEEENEFVAKERAEVPYEKRMNNIEVLRKQVFFKYLLPNGTWPSIEKTFKIMTPYTNDVSE